MKIMYTKVYILTKHFLLRYTKLICNSDNKALLSGCCSLLLSSVWLFVTPWTAAHQASLSFTIFLSLLKLIVIELVMPSNHLILCHPLLLLPSIFRASSFFQWVGSFYQVAKVSGFQYQSFQWIFWVDFL